MTNGVRTAESAARSRRNWTIYGLCLASITITYVVIDLIILRSMPAFCWIFEPVWARVVQCVSLFSCTALSLGVASEKSFGAIQRIRLQLTAYLIEVANMALI